MSDTDNGATGGEGQTKTELEVLKERAKVMGITHSGNIGVDALRAKIQAKLDGEPDPGGDEQNEANPLAEGGETPPVNETRAQIRERLLRDALALVRVRITNLDPKKKDLPGEILTVGNDFIGTVKKYIPYGEATDEGYHIPKILYDELESRRFLDIRVTKKNGREHVSQNMAREFSLEILPQLTQHELNRLAAQQAAAAGASN